MSLKTITQALFLELPQHIQSRHFHSKRQGGTGEIHSAAVPEPQVPLRMQRIFKYICDSVFWGSLVSLRICQKVYVPSLQKVKVLVTQLSPVLCDPTHYSLPDSCPRSSPGKNTGVHRHSLLQRIYLTQGTNPGLLLCRQILYHLSHHEIHKNLPTKVDI